MKTQKELDLYKHDVELFNRITETMREVFRRKRNDYGQTSMELLERFGPMSLLVRIYDKFARLETLLSGGEQRVLDENVDDTFLDLANYAIIAMIELEKQREGMMHSVERESMDSERRRVCSERSPRNTIA